MNIFKKLQAYLRFREAIRKADLAHSIDGKCYYVVPMVNGKLLIMDGKNFNILRRKGFISRDTKTKDLKASCLYHTPHTRGAKGMSAERINANRQRYYQMLG
jgi:hypothetical protein